MHQSCPLRLPHIAASDFNMPPCFAYHDLSHTSTESDSGRTDPGMHVHIRTSNSHTSDGDGKQPEIEQKYGVSPGRVLRKISMLVCQIHVESSRPRFSETEVPMLQEDLPLLDQTTLVNLYSPRLSPAIIPCKKAWYGSAVVKQESNLSLEHTRGQSRTAINRRDR